VMGTDYFKSSLTTSVIINYIGLYSALY